MSSAKLLLCVCAALALAMNVAAAIEPDLVEESTESPIADMALIADDVMMASKEPSEQPPLAAPATVPVAALAAESTAEKSSAQPHTVADFIIHPLIAFKPRQAVVDDPQGKQATPATPTSPTTWLFNMNPAQGLTSSISTLAGSVSGWFNDRLTAAGQQLPGLVDTPVRESTTTSSTTSTTQRPDIVVRLQQRPARRPAFNANGNGNGNANANANKNGNANRNQNLNQVRKRPNRFNNNNNRPINNINSNRFDSLEEDLEYDDEDYFQGKPNGNRFDEQFDDDEEASNEAAEYDDDEQSLEQHVNEQQMENKRRRPAQPTKQPAKQPAKQPVKQQRRKLNAQQSQPNRRRLPQPSAQRQQQLVQSTKRRRPVLAEEEQSEEQANNDDEEAEEEEEFEDDDEDSAAVSDEDDDVELYDDSDRFYYGAQPQLSAGASSTRRSQNQPNFIQRGQQNLINQLRQFTRGQTPAELGTKLRRTPAGGQQLGSKQRRPQQATLLVNRNGQNVYMAPELLNLSPYPSYYPAQSQVQPSKKKQQRLPAAGVYPQPPLTVPVRRQGRPTQYITIPWSQLGISPPDQSMLSLAEGIQAQPLILNIPQSAFQPQRGGAQQKKKKRPQLSAAAVPLLADASLMDIFQPPQIPPSRTGGGNNAPVLIASKPMKAGGSVPAMLPTRIRPATIVEKAPAMETMKPSAESEKPMAASQPAAAMSGDMSESATEMRNPEQEYILVGEDSEPGLTRQVQPVYGEARYFDFNPYYQQNRRFALRRNGRDLQKMEQDSEPMEESLPMGVVDAKTASKEHFIPVEIVMDESKAETVPQPMAAEAAPMVAPASAAPEPMVAPASAAPEPMVASASAAPEPSNEAAPAVAA